MIPFLEQLYKEIEHGDQEHRQWLHDKIEEFSNRNSQYDSTVDTLYHIKRVNQLLGQFAVDVIYRGSVHDNSKLEEPEKSIFDRYTPLLKGCVYGSEEYKQFLKDLKPALNHHYATNSHHPEFHQNGVSGMNLLDLVEMFFDWKAATERTKDGDIYKSIEQNKQRFGLSDQLVSILTNTAKAYQ
jgi:hypothetical protein